MNTNKSPNTCLCGVSEYMVLACSGTCDLSKVTDRVASKLRDNKVRKMNYLAVVGAGIEKSIENLKLRIFS
ncbi:MAG: hypothetical protein JXP36_07465 [Bacteroidales bacterium]|nr:hypothetical protein [Bacteroidales bacterium]